MDTSAVISGTDLSVIDGPIILPPSVVSEVKNRRAKNKLDIFLYTGNVIVVEPPPEYRKRAEKLAKQTGDLPYLSDTDLDVIALTFYIDDLKKNHRFDELGNIDSAEFGDIVTVTDDYSVQNVLVSVGLYVSSFKRKGISGVIRWETFCPLCGKTFPPEKNMNRCPNCGMSLKRRRFNRKK